MDGPGKVNPTPAQPLTPAQKTHWNSFVNWLQKAGYQGSKSLDNHNMDLGKNMLERFNSMYPGEKVTHADIPRVQAEIRANTDTAKRNDIPDVHGKIDSKTTLHKLPFNFNKTADPDTYIGKYGAVIKRSEYQSGQNNPENSLKFKSFEDYADWVGGWARKPGDKPAIPSSSAPPTNQISDYTAGFSSTYYPSNNQNKGKTIPTIPEGGK